MVLRYWLDQDKLRRISLLLLVRFENFFDAGELTVHAVVIVVVVFHEIFDHALAVLDLLLREGVAKGLRLKLFVDAQRLVLISLCLLFAVFGLPQVQRRR